MNEQLIEATAAYTGFTPWEIVLMTCVAGLFLIMVKLFREAITATNNSTNAINNNTTAFKEFKSEIIERIKEIKE